MMRTMMRLVRQGFADMGLYPWVQVCTLAAVTLMVFLSGLFLITLVTLNHELGTVKGETAFQVYWRAGSEMTIVEEQWGRLKNLPWFTGLKTFTPQQALEELGTRLHGKQASPEKLFPFLTGKNPLPATALVSFAPEEEDTERWLKETAEYLQNLPGVERVLATPLRDELGQAWRKAGRYVMWPTLTFLGLLLGLVVGNTVRLSLFARAHEIEILQLVGAPNWYVRLPLLVNGATVGLLGGCLALVLLRFTFLQVHSLLQFPPLFMEIRFLPLELCLALVALPTLTGMVASYLAVRGDPSRSM